MCTECGCGLPLPTSINGKQQSTNGGEHSHDAHLHSHDHDHDHVHSHSHSHESGSAHAHTHGPDLISVHKSILSANNLQAERNRGFFRGIGLLALNLLSSPGAGKTALLKRTIQVLGAGW
ncbi:MAG TPA: hypothetical protein PKE54_02810 [Candidatus Obscuribacter sp.]|nr:hypothetical protein [Candidatus Obscuribacter sp.]